MTLARVKTWIAGEVLTASDLNTEFDHCDNNLAVSTELSASSGSSLIGFIQSGTGAVARTLQSKARDVVSVFDFMTAAQIADVQAGTLSIDVSAAVQAAINAVCPTFASNVGFAGRVIFPGIGTKYLIGTRLDCTNSRVNGTKGRDGLILDGDAAILVGQTGSGKSIIETTGSQFLTITRGVTLDTTRATSNKSTVGLLQGVSTALNQTQNQRIECQITLHDDATANANLGTVACWNFGAEECTYDTIYWSANIPIVLTSANDGTQPGPFTNTSYTTLQTAHSLGVTTFTGECFLASLNRRNPPMIIQNITSLNSDNLYIVNSGTGGTNKSAVWLFGNAVNVNLRGVIEGLETLRLDGALINSKWVFTWGGVDNTSEPVIRVKRTAANVVQQSQIVIDLEANYTRAILTTNDGDEATASSYSILDSSITAWRADSAALADSQLYMPVNVAANANSLRWQLIGGVSRVDNSAFAAGPNGDTLNITGDATTYAFNAAAWTKVFDVGSCFDATTGIFTAKQTGDYEFYIRLACDGGAAGHTDAQLVLVVAGNGYLVSRMNAAANLYAGSAEWMIQGWSKVIMNRGDTAYIQLYVSGGAKTIDILSGGSGVNYRTRFEGRKVA